MSADEIPRDSFWHLICRQRWRGGRKWSLYKLSPHLRAPITQRVTNAVKALGAWMQTPKPGSRTSKILRCVLALIPEPTQDFGSLLHHRCSFYLLLRFQMPTPTLVMSFNHLNVSFELLRMWHYHTAAGLQSPLRVSGAVGPSESPIQPLLPQWPRVNRTIQIHSPVAISSMV